MQRDTELVHELQKIRVVAVIAYNEPGIDFILLARHLDRDSMGVTTDVIIGFEHTNVMFAGK
jgi:hypothetical protein